MITSARWLPLLATLAAAVVAPSCGGGAVMEPPPPPPSSGWTLVWSDEFNGTNGSTPDPAKWTYDLGGGGWGNQELETYTNRAVNAQVQRRHHAGLYFRPHQNPGSLLASLRTL